jgi:hypothetical protein
MSTRSEIIIEEVDGSASLVYNHFSGYPSYTGKILLENYQSEEKIRGLVAGGGIRNLKPELADVKYVRSEVPERLWNDRIYQIKTAPTVDDIVGWHGGSFYYKYSVKDGKWYIRACSASIGILHYTNDFVELTPKIVEKDMADFEYAVLFTLDEKVDGRLLYDLVNDLKKDNSDAISELIYNNISHVFHDEHFPCTVIERLYGEESGELKTAILHFPIQDLYIRLQDSQERGCCFDLFHKVYLYAALDIFYDLQPMTLEHISDVKCMVEKLERYAEN